MSWCVVVDPYDGPDLRVVGPFDTQYEADTTALRIWNQGDYGTLVVEMLAESEVLR